VPAGSTRRQKITTRENIIMAEKIQSITAYRPRIEYGQTAGEERFLELVTSRTTLSNGVVKNVQEAEVEALIGLLLDGRPVHTGIGIYTPSIDLDGKLEVKVKVDKRILQALNSGAFRGRLINADNIGKTGDELVAIWNEAHHDDLVV
jgi:hypothetical protein